MSLAEYQRSWLARGRTGPVYPVMRFTEDRLELGGGTVIARMADGGPKGRTLDIDGRESRILALLAAAYQRPIPIGVLDNVRRAGREWQKGEACLAQIHLAFTGLSKLEAPDEAAYRLFIADELMNAGTSPRDIFRALDLDPVPVDVIEKTFNAAEARIPAGFGAASGEWTFVEDIGKGLMGMELAPEAVLALSAYAASLVATSAKARAALGHLFLPTPAMPGPVTGYIPGNVDVQYRWNAEEGSLVFSQKVGTTWVPFKEAHVGADGIYRDHARKPIGRELDGHIVIDLAVATARLEPEKKPSQQRAPMVPLPLRVDQDDEPKLCPAPTPDKPGRLGTKEEIEEYKKDRDYEDFRKAMVNPGNPTPRAFGVKLSSPVPGEKPVHYDDCQRRTGKLFEYKGTGYAAMLAKAAPPPGRKPDTFPTTFLTVKWLRQAKSQVAASGGRQIEWDFAEKPTRDYLRKLFNDNRKLKRIKTEWYNWSEKSK